MQPQKNESTTLNGTGYKVRQSTEKVSCITIMVIAHIPDFWRAVSSTNDHRVGLLFELVVRHLGLTKSEIDVSKALCDGRLIKVNVSSFIIPTP